MLGHYEGPEDFVRVSTAEPEDAATVVEHVAALGYDGCLQVTGPLAYAHERRRLELLRRLCAEHGLAHSQESARYAIGSGQDAVRRADVTFCSRPAVIASSDLIAVGALRAAAALGLRIPEEMGLVSWDDSLIAEVASPSGGDLLVRRIEGTASRGERMQTAPAGLVPRASTARP